MHTKIIYALIGWSFFVHFTYAQHQIVDTSNSVADEVHDNGIAMDDNTPQPRIFGLLGGGGGGRRGGLFSNLLSGLGGGGRPGFASYPGYGGYGGGYPGYGYGGGFGAPGYGGGYPGGFGGGFGNTGFFG